MKITISYLAKYLGLSEATVSLALNDKKGVSPRTKKIVLEAAEKLGYTPDYFARSLATQQGTSIGLIVPEIENPFYGALTQAIDFYVREKGYQLLLGISDFSIETEERLIRHFISMRATGILISPTYAWHTPESYRELVSANAKNIIYVGAHYEFNHHYVMTNLMEGSFQLTSNLLDKGYSNIVFISGDPDIVIAKDRLMGYYAAYMQRGISISSNVIQAKHFQFEEAYMITKDLLNKEPLPNAIITMNDVMALGVMKAVLEAGLRIPQDLAVAGYDDVLFASLATVPLTTVRQPIKEVARIAVEHLLSMDKQEQKDRFIQIKITPEIIIRQST